MQIQDHKYKKTELGEIPEDWHLSSLDELGEIITGSTPPTKNKECYGKDFPWATIPDLEDKYIKRTRTMLSLSGYKKTRKITKDAILVACIGSIGKVGIASSEMSTNQQINSIICNNVSNEFVYYQLIHNQTRLQGLANQVAVPIINKSNFGKFKIFLPNNNKEQQKIASILSNVDNLIQKTDQLIEQTQRLKKGLMQRLLTKGIVHTKFKKTELGEIPEEWNLVKINDITIVNPDKINDKYEYDEINYLEIGAIVDYEITDFVNYKTMSRPSRAQRVIKYGDIVVSTVRPYLKGFSLINDSKKNLVCSTGFAVLRPIDKSDTNFIFNYIKSKIFEDQLFKQMEGMAYPAVTSSDIANVLIPFTNDSKEKDRIGTILYNLDSYYKYNKLTKLHFEKLKKGLMQQLLTGKIRVKV